MKQSTRAKRLAKHHKRLNANSKLNLVSLMDIFTILVFFLIVNQSEVRVLPNTKVVKLPVSIAETLPTDNVVVTVLENKVLVQNQVVWQLDSTNATATDHPQLIEAIKTELAYQSTKRKELTELEKSVGRSVTILGNQTIPYELLKQIMTACADSNYRNISLAVEQQATKNKSEGAS